MAMTKPSSSQVTYSGTTVNKVLEKSVLSYDTYSSASAAADTLPDGQVVYVESDETKDSRKTRYSVQTGSLVFSEFVKTELSGSNLAAVSSWANVPEVLDFSAAQQAASNAQAQALLNRTEFLAKQAPLDDLDPYQSTKTAHRLAGDVADFVTNIRNTVDGQVTTNVLWTAAEDTDAKKLIKAFTSIPSGHVFSRFSLFNATGVNIVSRPVIVRPTYVGKASVGYVEKVFKGITFFVCTVGGQWVDTLRQTVYDGTLRTLTNHLVNQKVLVGDPYPRLAFNTSPSGTGAFPTYVADGALVPGDDANPYFISSAYITADQEFVVVPHIGQPTSIVTNMAARNRIVQSFHFRYVLVKDGSAYDLVGNGYTTPTGLTGIPSARTIIGQKANGQLFVAACTGDTGTAGATIQDVIDFALSEGCINCFNLDGGGSTTFMSRGAIKNVPSDPGGERAIPAIAYIV